eukprot:365095-Chlamydomonas_euryale.AAC.5
MSACCARLENNWCGADGPEGRSARRVCHPRHRRRRRAACGTALRKRRWVASWRLLIKGNDVKAPGV